MIRHVEVDVLLLGDPRDGGEGAATLGDLLGALSTTGLAVALAPLRGPREAARPVHPALAEAVRTGALSLIDPASGPVACQLAILVGPELLARALPLLPPLTAGQVLVLLPSWPVRAKGAATFDPQAAASLVAERLGARQRWCPRHAGIRERCRGIESDGMLSEEDWPVAVAREHWRLPRPQGQRQQIVLGRALPRGSATLARNRSALLRLYPQAADLAVRFLGDSRELKLLASPLPPGWQIIGRGAATPRRFLSRLDFCVVQPEKAPTLLSRNLIETLASGRVAILAPGLKPLLGEGRAYRTPEQTADTARYLQSEPDFYARYVTAQDQLLEAYSTAALLRRLEPYLPQPRVRRSPARSARTGGGTLAFYPTNGVGLGHVTRLLAIARRLDPGTEPVFFTPCHALSVIEHAGYRTEYVSEPSYNETSPAENARAIAPSLARALRHHEARAIVFDGNVPREGLIAAAARNDLPFIWVRRGMWRADPSLARFLRLSCHADVVIEPAEAAAAVDTGVTAEAVDGAIKVPPIVLLDPAELLSRAAARAALKLPTDRVCALVQLGSGNNRDIEILVDHIVAAAERLGIDLLVAEWLISHRPVRRRNVRYLSAFPNARYLNAFDFALTAAGYNSFHELMHMGVPCIFLPNDDQKVDDQRARAMFADAQGAGICVPRGAEAQVGRYMEILAERSHRRLIARRARTLCPLNGARAAAEAIQSIVARQ